MLQVLSSDSSLQINMRGVVAAYEKSFIESDAGTEALVLKRTTGEREATKSPQRSAGLKRRR
jgi:hypothetical protein